jgi:hypothetical protein
MQAASAICRRADDDGRAELLVWMPAQTSALQKLKSSLSDGVRVRTMFGSESRLPCERMIELRRVDAVCVRGVSS